MGVVQSCDLHADLSMCYCSHFSSRQWAQTLGTKERERERERERKVVADFYSHSQK